MEEVFLPVIGAIVNGQFHSWGEGLDGPDVGFVRVFVSPDFHISSLCQTVVNTPPPTVSVCWVCVDDDRQLSGFR